MAPQRITLTNNGTRGAASRHSIAPTSDSGLNPLRNVYQVSYDTTYYFNMQSKIDGQPAQSNTRKETERLVLLLGLQDAS